MNSFKGGNLARRAAMLCQDTEFGLYLDRRARHKFGADVPDGTHNQQDARDFIVQACGIQSRAELDHNRRAAYVFNQIYRRFLRYKAQSQQ